MDFDYIIYWVKKVYFALIVVVGVLLLFIYTFQWPKIIDINEKTLALLVILMIAPILNRLSKIKIGGLLEAEMDKEVRKQAVNVYEKSESEKNLSIDHKVPISGKISATGSASGTISMINKYQDILDTSNISLLASIVKLRQNLEKSLSDLYLINHPEDIRLKGAGSYIKPLIIDEVLPIDLANSLRDVISIANKAIHGSEEIRPEDIKLAILAGVNLLDRLDNIYEKTKEKKEKEMLAHPPTVKS
jgi:hypothetical protein